MRRFVLLSLFALTALSCNRGVQPGVLRFSHFWSEPAQHAFMDTLLAGFHREHPDIPVEVSELSWSDGKTKLMIGFNSETAPDVIELGSDWVPQFSSSGVLENLSNVPALAPRFANAPQYSLAPGDWNGQHYAVPWVIDTRIMFVNDSLIAAAGLPKSDSVLASWESMYAAAEAVEKSGKGHGLGINGADQHRLYKKFLPYVWSNGGELFDASGKPTMTLPQNVEALKFYVDQQKVGMVEVQKNVDDAFKRGNLAIWFSGSWLLPALSKVSWPWHAELFPGHQGHVGESFAGAEFLAINDHSSMKHEAEIFLEYITRPDNELAFAKMVNMYPADTSSQKDSFYYNRPAGAVFTRQLAHARMIPVIPQWLDFEAILEDEVSRALYNKETPEQAMASMQRRTEELLKRK
jgi:multiple sugar transport system substrate-binding protein